MTLAISVPPSIAQFTDLWLIGVDNSSQAEFEHEDDADDFFYLEDGDYTGTTPPGALWNAGPEPWNDGVAGNAIGFERAFTAGDPIMHIYFQLDVDEADPSTTFNFEADFIQGEDPSSHDFEFRVNGTPFHSQAEVSANGGAEVLVTDTFMGVDVGTVVGPNVLTIERVGGIGGWVQLDYLRLQAGVTPYRAGDATRDGEFNSADLVAVFVQGYYLVGQPATWDGGDWNGAPGGEIGGPPPLGDGRFDQFDLIAAFYDPTYERGPYASIPLPPTPLPDPYAPLEGGAVGDGNPSLVYDFISGELELVADGIQFTTLNLRHKAGGWIGPHPAGLDGLFDVATSADLFKLAPQGFGDISFGAALPPGLDAPALRRSVEIIGTRLAGGAIENIDLLCLLPNDQFADSISLGEIRSATGSGKNTGAALEPGEIPLHPSAHGRTVWWNWIAPEDGMVSIDTAGSNFDTILAVFTGETVDALNQIAVNHGGASADTSAVSIGAGVGTLSLAGANNLVDTPSDGTSDQSRQNVDLSFTQTLPAGTYRATTWSYNAGQSGSVTPYLAFRLAGSPRAYEVVAVGDRVDVVGGFDVDTTVGFGGSDTFTLSGPTEVFAGILNPKMAGSQNPVFANLASGGLTDHDNNADGNLSPAIVGGKVDGFDFSNLPRSYAFSIEVEQQVPSRVAFFAEAGVAYHIAVDGFDGSDPTGLIALNIRPQLRITDIALVESPGADGLRDVQITWVSEPDRDYALQLSGDLTDWSEIGVVDSGGNTTSTGISGLTRPGVFLRIAIK